MHTRSVQFIGLGGAHSGSGFLYKYLESHPSIKVLKQPTHFFTDTEVYQKGLEWYAAHFAPTKGGVLWGEVASDYVYDSEAPERIAHIVPEAKLLVVVCNPIERLYKEYEYHISRKNDGSKMSFEEYIEKHPDALERGLFGRSLTAYFDLYSPISLQVFVHEDRYDDPVAYVQSAYAFLEVEEAFVPKPLRQFVAPDPDFVPSLPWYMRLLHIFFFPIWLFRINRLVMWGWKHLRQYLPKRLRALPKKPDRPRIPQPTPLPIAADLYEVLADYYAADVRKLSHLVQRDLNTEWNIQSSS